MDFETVRGCAPIDITEFLTNGYPDPDLYLPVLGEELKKAEYQARAHARDSGGDYTAWGLRGAQLGAEIALVQAHTMGLLKGR